MANKIRDPKNKFTKSQTQKKVWLTKLQILKNKLTKFQTHKNIWLFKKII